MGCCKGAAHCVWGKLLYVVHWGSKLQGTPMHMSFTQELQSMPWTVIVCSLGIKPSSLGIWTLPCMRRPGVALGPGLCCNAALIGSQGMPCILSCATLQLDCNTRACLKT